MKQKEVATMLGLKDTSSLSRWEKGISIPSLVQLLGLSRIYKTMPNELYFDLWLSISKEISERVNALLAQKESINSNSNIYL